MFRLEIFTEIVLKFLKRNFVNINFDKSINNLIKRIKFKTSTPVFSKTK